MKLIKNIKIWFKYNIIFWRIIKVQKSILGMYDIERMYYDEYIIQHIITLKTLSYDGYGGVLKQKAIYKVNNRLDIIREKYK